MKTKHKTIRTALFGFGTVAILAVVFGANGCASNNAGSTTQPALASSGPPSRSGQQLLDDNCSRCHNTRPPEEYSDQQWAAIVMHMRLRADLTGNEQRKITAFLQASN